MKISEIRLGATVAALVELDTFFDLLAYAFLGAAVRRVERVVATEGAASCGDCTVAVGTAETGVDADFLDTGAELALKVRGVGVETTVIVPGEHVVMLQVYRLQIYDFFLVSQLVS